jgi:hypothetical protein
MIKVRVKVLSGNKNPLYIYIIYIYMIYYITLILITYLYQEGRMFNLGYVRDVIYSYNNQKCPDFPHLIKLANEDADTRYPVYWNVATKKTVRLNRRIEYYSCACKQYRSQQEALEHQCTLVPLLKLEPICTVKYLKPTQQGQNYFQSERWRKDCWLELAPRLTKETTDVRLAELNSEAGIWFEHHKPPTIENLLALVPSDDIVSNAPAIRRGRPKTLASLGDALYKKYSNLKNELYVYRNKRKTLNNRVIQIMRTDPLKVNPDWGVQLLNYNKKIEEMEAELLRLRELADGKQPPPLTVNSSNLVETVSASRLIV